MAIEKVKLSVARRDYTLPEARAQAEYLANRFGTGRYETSKPTGIRARVASSWVFWIWVEGGKDVLRQKMKEAKVLKGE